MFRSVLFVGLTLAAAASSAMAGLPLTTAKCSKVVYNIPSQALSPALEAYAAASSLQIIYDKPADADLYVGGVTGCMDRTVALRILLQGTGLVVRFYNAQDVVLGLANTALASKADTTPPIPTNIPILPIRELDVHAARMPDMHANWLYANMIENIIRTALLRDPATRDRNYLVGIQIWIRTSGMVDRFSLVSPSGDRHLDDAVTAVLRSIAVHQLPPPELAQPITVWIRSRPTS